MAIEIGIIPVAQENGDVVTDRFPVARARRWGAGKKSGIFSIEMLGFVLLYLPRCWRAYLSA